MTNGYPKRKYPLEYHKDGKWITEDKSLTDQTTARTFEVCKKAKSEKLEQVKRIILMRHHQPKAYICWRISLPFKVNS